MADNGVYIPVQLKIDEAEKQLNSFAKKIAKTELDLNVNTTQLENARKQFEAIQNEAKELEKQIYALGNQNKKGEWVAYNKENQGEMDTLVARLREIDSRADPLGEKVARLTAENEKLTESLKDLNAGYAETAKWQNDLIASQYTLTPVSNEPLSATGLLGLSDSQAKMLKFKEFFSDVMADIEEACKVAGRGVLDAIGAIIGGIANLAWQGAKWLGSHLLPAIKGVAKGAVKLALDFNPFLRILKAIQPVVKRVMRLASRALIFNTISRMFRAMSTELRNLISGNTELTRSLGALKGAFITAFAPILSWVIPIIIKLINLMTQLMGALANFTASLFGKTAQQAQANAKALDAQAKSAKGAGKAMKSLMSIDEINQLSDKGGGGSSGGATFDNDMSFDVSGWLANLGTDLANKLNEIIATVDWKGIGLKLGDWLRQMINTGLDFLRTFNFKGAGSALAETINGIVSQLNPHTLGETLFRFFKSGIDFLVGFVQTADWGSFVNKMLSTAKTVAQMFAEAMRNIDWKGIAQKMYTFMREAVSNTDWWEIAKNILTGLANGLWGLIQILWEAIKGIFWGLVDLVKSILGIKSPSTVFAEIGVMLIQGLINGVKSMWETVKQLFVSLWNMIKGVFSTVGTWFSTTFTNAWNKLKELFGKGGTVYTGILNAFTAVWTGIKGIFGSVADWFKSVFSNAWEKVKGVFSKGGVTFEGIKDGISTTFKAIVNGLIGGINAVIAVPFRAINTALSKIRDLSIAGLTPFKGRISLINIPSIPYLAQGTVVPPNNKFLAMLGDNKSETEVVSPLSTMKEALMEALAESRQHVTVNVDGKALFEIIIGQNNAEVRRTGESPLLV